MSNGIAGLRGYQEGDLVEDDPGWWERFRERRRQGQRESTEPRFSIAGSYGLGFGLPLAARQIAGDIIGKQVRERLGMERLGNLIGSRDITAGDMSRAELNALQDAVLRGMGGTLQDKSYLEYEDYATAREGEDAYSDVGGSGGSGIIRKFFDPSFSAKATFGQAKIEKDEETGDYYLIDRYNFNERLPGLNEFGRNPEWGGDYLTREEGGLPGFLDILGARVADQGAYGVPRALGQAYGSPEGEGSLARVNLGNLEEALARSRGEDEGIFAQIMNRIRGLRGDDERETVAQYVPEPEIPSAPPSLASFISPDFIPDFSEPPREIMARNILEE